MYSSSVIFSGSFPAGRRGYFSPNKALFTGFIMRISRFSALNSWWSLRPRNLHHQSPRDLNCLLFPQLELSVDLGQHRPAIESSKCSSLLLTETIARLRQGGGDRATDRHTRINRKIPVWRRIEMLVDNNTEILDLAPLAGAGMPYGDVPYAGLVAVIARVSGRYCVVCANDATVKGGTYFPITVTKTLRAQQLSASLKLPLISLVDSGGGFLPLQADLFPDKNHGGRSFFNQAVQSAAGVAQLAVVCGACTAGAAYGPTMSDETIMVDGIGSLFLAGPPLVRAATGQIVSDQELGGCRVHCSVSGCCDHSAAHEWEALALCRQIVASLEDCPPHSTQLASREPLVSADVFDLLAGRSGSSCLTRDQIYLLLSALLDASRFREFRADYGTSIVTGFGRLSGTLVGLVANCGRSVTHRDAEKLAHFVQMCDQRQLTLLFLQNGDSGCSPEIDNCEHSSEHSTTIQDDVESPTAVSATTLKCLARAVAAISASRVARLVVNIAGCHGDQHLFMSGVGMQPLFYFAWPSAAFSPLHMQYQSDVTLSDGGIDSDLSIPIDSCSSYYYASRVLIDSVIQPNETRRYLALCLDILKENTVSLNNIKHKSREYPILRM